VESLHPPPRLPERLVDLRQTAEEAQLLQSRVWQIRTKEGGCVAPRVPPRRHYRKPVAAFLYSVSDKEMAEEAVRVTLAGHRDAARCCFRGFLAIRPPRESSESPGWQTLVRLQTNFNCNPGQPAVPS
jgi:hypothetical protein